MIGKVIFSVNSIFSKNTKFVEKNYSRTVFGFQISFTLGMKSEKIIALHRDSLA